MALIHSIFVNKLLLSYLQVLEVCHNNLTHLPDDIGHIQTLEVLSCGSNDITELPSSILKLRSVRYVNFVWGWKAMKTFENI